MAGEIQTQHVTGSTIYAFVYSSTGSIYNTVSGLFETWADISIGNYDIALIEQGTSGFYIGNFPSVVEGFYSAISKSQAGGSPAVSDTLVGAGNINWSGTEVIGGGGTEQELEINVGHSDQNINVSEGLSSRLTSAGVSITKGVEKI